MTPIVIGLVLFAALMHASWNALLRSGTNRLRSIVMMNATSAAVALPFAICLSPAAHISWPYIGFSVLLQIGYCIFLERAYRGAELSQVYPVVRGTSPLLVTLGAAILVGERLTPSAIAGVAIVSFGIMALAFERARPATKMTLTAMATGAFIAAFTVTDGVGARLSGHAVSYAAWLFLLQGIAMPFVYIAMRGRLIIGFRDPEAGKAATGGILALLAYGSIIVALSISPLGPVAALRELSIVFALIIGVVFLKEPMTAGRVGAATMIALGAIILSVARR
jgi:drug/metabolite transporter (DMT)-like permease